MNGSVLNGNHFESLVCFYESRVSNCLLSAQKPPHTEGGAGGNCICCNNFDLNRINYRERF